MSTLTEKHWKQLNELMNGYIYSQTLVSACNFDLFTLLSRKPGSVQEELCQSLGLSPYCTRVLMLAVCAVGLVRRDTETGGYYNSDLAEKVLVSGSQYSMLPFIEFNHRIQQRCIGHFTESLKENRNAGLDEFPGQGRTLYERLAGYPELENLFQEGMGAYTRLSPKMIDLSEFSGVQHLLDVGGGDGSNAVRLCQRFPALRVTILEKPSVTQIAKRTVIDSGLSERISCIELDMFADPWPQGCDAVLFSHVVEIFSPDKILSLYRKAYSSLPRGGTMFVWTIMANEFETAALQAAKSSIYFLSTASGEGMAYPAKDHEQFARDAGFKGVEHYGAMEVDHGALVAVK